MVTSALCLVMSPATATATARGAVVADLIRRANQLTRWLAVRVLSHLVSNDQLIVMAGTARDSHDSAPQQVLVAD